MNSTQLITESHEHQKGKVCNKCKEHLPLSEFYNCTRIKDGKGGTCKICVNDYQSNRPEFTRWYITKKKDGKSVKWTWFHANAVELIRLKNPVRWNLNKLFEEVI